VELLESLTQHPWAIKLIVTVGIFGLIVLGRRISVRTFDTSGLPPERRNRFLVQSRNAAIVLFLAATLVLWAEQLQTVALSLAALGVAFVIATKELILCVSGTLLRVSARSFRLGDRIEVDGRHGDVIDIGPLTTTLLEIGPEPSIHKLTGRMVVLPNSLFLSSPVINETFTERFVLHTTRVELDPGASWREAEAMLLKAANNICSDYVDDAQKNMERVGHKFGLEAPDVRPKVWVSLRNAELGLILRYPAPMRGRGQVEQLILRAYLDYRDTMRAKSDATQPEA
jgi:small-conductance mechanosensitive channel